MGNVSSVSNVITACDNAKLRTFYCPTPTPTPTPGWCLGVPDYNQFATTGCAAGFINDGGICNRDADYQNSCAAPGGYDQQSCSCPDGFDQCSPYREASCYARGPGWTWDEEICFCVPYLESCEDCENSPIVVDATGNGFSLTSFANGVHFDLDSNGVAEQLSWTSGSSDDAWLVLDRNQNGTIDDGRELFGNYTAQPAPPTGEEKNGFLALAVFDRAAKGGNGDGMITRRDAVFDRLRLWRDSNHNGVSEQNELVSLVSLGIAQLDLDYKESLRTDQFGNRFKYRARVRDINGEQSGRWIWDVFLVGQ